MLAFGLSSGLPFALLVGTLTAWLGEVGVKLATIGVFSWIGLAYSFQFLWSPIVDRLRLPGLERLGRRKGWIVLCQAVVLAAFAGLAMTDPAADIGRFVLVAFAGAVASATQDIAINGWRIDNADEETPIGLLTALYQFGYRTASIIGGAIALVLASSMSWPQVYLVMAALIGLLVFATLAAPDTPRPPPATLEGALAEPGALKPRTRAMLLLAVGASWLWAIFTIVRFMISMLADTPPDVPRPSVTEFSLTYGPLILLATVFLPLLLAALANWLKRQPERVLAAHDTTGGAGRGIANHLYSALVDTLSDLCARLGWGVLVILGFILTYAICYNIWASFAYPFYLGELKYTKEEVAFASKVFGIVMTMLGISLGGYLYGRIGRFPTVLLGAILPPLGNFLYADLADGGKGIDAFSHLLRLDALAQMFGSDERMVRLMLAICYENVSTGLALTAFVAYVSSIVSKKYAAIQYALLSSLVSLVGTLGRGAVGRAFDQFGYAPVFRWTAATALVAVLFVALEWARTSRIERRLSRESGD
ncbi:MAG: MFS transporter [Sphingomonadales bacterium]|nr:MFS transporter [Sphingomonadales bacterium]MDE2569426.1 MFS transporter [Sphingomonadales bacterium]